MSAAILRPGQVALLDQIDDVIAGGCEAPSRKRKNLTLNQAVDVLLHRDGQLILTHGSGHVVTPGRGGQHGGGTISAESAETVKKRQDCVEISSGLFPGCAQSWALIWR
jgi:hypothetical protein